MSTHDVEPTTAQAQAGGAPMDNRQRSSSYGPAPLAPATEFTDRVGRLQGEMESAGVDFVVVTSRENFEYFSNYRSMAWTYHARPLFLVVGRSSATIVASRADESSLAVEDNACDVLIYEGFLPEAADAVASICGNVHESPHASTVIALDYGHELAGRGSLRLIEGLTRQGTVVEAGDVLWNVRLIKSEFELGLMRTTFDIINRSFDTVLESLRTGITEWEVFSALQVELVRHGADRVDPFSVLFGKAEFRFHRPSSNRRLERNDYLWTDFRSCYGGYPADRNRTARVGAPSSAERDAYSAVRSVTIEVCNGIRPGMTCAEVYTLYSELWNAAGLPKSWSVSGAGRIGHGGGVGLTEPPSLAATSNELIKPGMVLHVEPKLQTADGVFQCEEIVYIGEDSNEFLSVLSPAELPVIEP